MNKEEFGLILNRQHQSGLSVRDFCTNEGYTLSSFWYWKSKFGYCKTTNELKPDNTHGQINTFVPISIGHLPAISDQPQTVPGNSRGEIQIKLPNGTQLSFKGDAQLNIAFHLLNQICSAYVQP